MVEKLSVQIALEGGAAVERQLADIGKAGQQAFADIEKSASQVGGFKNLKPEEVTAKLKALGLEGTAAFDKIQTAVQSAGRWEGLVQGITSVETGLAALGRVGGPVIAGLIAGAGAIVAAWSGVAKSINEVDATAAKLGVSFQQFDKLRQGFLQAGISSEAVTGGLEKLKSQLDQMDVERVKKAFNELADAATRGFGAQGTAQLQILQQAAKGVGPAAEAARKALVDLGQVPVGEQLGKATEAFQRLGIEGRTLSEVVPQIVAKLQAMPDGVERTNLAISLLGDKLGVELVAALRTGSLTIEQFNAATGNLTREQQISAAQTQQSINMMSTAWDDFKASVVAPIAVPLFGILKTGLQEISQLAANTKRELEALAPSADTVLKRIQEQAGQTNQALQQTGQAGAQAGQQAAQGLQLVTNPLTGMPELILTTNQALQQTGQAGQQAGQQAAEGLQLVTNPLTGMPELINKTNQALQTIGPTAAQAGQTAASGWDTFLAKLDEIARKAGQILGGGGGGRAGAPAMAGGGLLGGRGTGTSDSNLAWVSRGEYITPARAVAQPGVLAFLEALRRSGGNLGRVLDGMGRFALGGMVPRAMPAFAGGGAVGSMSHVTIAFPGLPAIGGLRASSDVVDQLQKAAALAQVRSGGRKPSRYS